MIRSKAKKDVKQNTIYNVALRDSRVATLEAQTSLEAGFERGLLKIQQQTQDLASVVDGALTNAFKGAEDAFVNFVETGKLDFSGLVDSMYDFRHCASCLSADSRRIVWWWWWFGGYANGGDFTVGGRGGTDNNILSVNGQPVAKVSRGENVAVTPQGGSNSGRPIVINMNIQTPDADSFQRSQGQIQARMQQALSRASQRNN